MGQYIVNGEVIDIRGDNVTAQQLKQQLDHPQNDWVMVKRTDGMHHLLDHEVIPFDVQRISIVPAFEYGLG